ncbi:T6SS immunity protein Tli4 family protein [Pseudomonas sp. NPDC089743]|uniref:T6SS immunity protein Tli4 family protein n=1 Tax=Pseudomonas sp. NPDC089743 TaxID=3364471 RepID=UPI0037FC046A
MNLHEDHSSSEVLVGKYIMQLPDSAEMSEAFLNLDGIPIKILPRFLEARTARHVEKAWTEIELRNKKNKEGPAIRENLPGDATLFQYDHIRITGQGLDGKEINKVVHSTMAFGWMNNLMFQFGNDDTLGAEDKIKVLWSKVKLSQSNANNQHLCFAQACIEHSSLDESANLIFKINKFKNLTASFKSAAYIGEPHLPLSEQKLDNYNPVTEADWISQNDFTRKTFRNNKRSLDGLSGEENIHAATYLSEGVYRTEVHAKWYFPGTPEKIDRPEISIDLDFSYITQLKPASPAGFSTTGEDGSPTEDQFMAIWDAALSSLKSR